MQQNKCITQYVVVDSGVKLSTLTEKLLELNDYMKLACVVCWLVRIHPSTIDYLAGWCMWRGKGKV